MNFGPITTETTMAIRPAMKTRTITRVSFARAGAMPSSATERDALTSTASPAGRASSGRRERSGGVRLPRVGPVAARELADREHLDPELVRQLRDLAVMPLGVLAELGHAAEDREAPAARPPLGEVPQRRLHRGRVRVVGVVDDEAAAGERQLLAAPRRELHAPPHSPSSRSSGRSERVVGGQRGERVLRLVARGEREADPAARRRRRGRRRRAARRRPAATRRISMSVAEMRLEVG